MTSEATGGKTLRYFSNRNWFGLKKENLVVFEQFMLPCFTMDGKMILEKPYSLARAPDGNGGLYRALRDHHVLSDMESRGIKYVHVYCVDNILVKMADPVCIGYMIEQQSDCIAKVVSKSHAGESVGVCCSVDGVYQVVEYSEISDAISQKTDDKGELVYNSGNICNHMFTTDFLKYVSIEHDKEMKLHVARKKIPYMDKEGNEIKPTKPNGIKIEKFVFDVIQFSKNFHIWEVLREDEFSPLKNGDGAEKDTPTTAREALCSL